MMSQTDARMLVPQATTGGVEPRPETEIDLLEFPEPRAWALQWEGSALLPAAVGAAQYSRGEHVPIQAGEEVPGWVVMAPVEMGQDWLRNGDGTIKATRPKGWAMEWDGAALFESEVW